MKLNFHVEPSPLPEVLYTILVEGKVIAEGLNRVEADFLFEKSTGYVVMNNQYGHCHIYKGRDSFGDDEDGSCSECGEDSGTKCGAVGCPY
jgi:hypothetical protein